MTHSKKGCGLVKAETGIQGFDAITDGGLPQGRTTLIMGGPGSGKTVFALQALLAGVRRGEPGIFVTFQESPRQIMENAASFGWDLRVLEKDKLVILDSRIRSSTFKSIELYLNGMLAGIRVVAMEMGAKNIVFDSVDALFLLLGDRTSEREGIFRLRDWLVESELTALLTAQADETSVFHRHGQFTADCVINLQQHLADERTARSLRMVKYRGSGFVERETAFGIGPAGIEMSATGVKSVKPRTPEAASALQAEIAATQAAFQARIQSLTQQLEMKQSELDFLMKEKGQAASPATIRNRPAVSKSQKPVRNAPAVSARRSSPQMARKQA